MPSLAQVQSDNASWVLPTTYIPVFIVVGGTSGLGQGILEALGRHTHGRANLIIVGRNRAAAERSFAKFPAPEGSGITHEFVECDLASIAAVKRMCSSLLSRFSRIHLLVMTAGALTMQSAVTAEGLQASVALLYYARWTLINELLPALVAAKEAGEDARVFSVLNAGMGKRIDFDDLGLKKRMAPGSLSVGTLVQAAASIETYLDFMVMAYAHRNPSIPFVHASPGTVRTPVWDRSSSWTIRIFGMLMKFLGGREVKIIEQCGEHQLYSIRHMPPGASWRGPDGDDMGHEKVCGTIEDADRLWAHMVVVVEAIRP
uniref:Ketoreductase (KR) domain-containing protein n=1 Tax=Mycena chlorophos TaxID=658473 RepID=A0ABQ0LZB8_MYCCL|nr:predicted protein [Mycena chlorophos]